MARRSNLGELPRPTAVPLLRVLFFTLALVSLVCGYVGLAIYLNEVGGWSDHPLDLLYFDLQLFALSSPPLGAGGPYPLALDIARFGAPAVTVYALVEAGRLLFATELRRLRTRNARGHVVVCGDTLVAGTLTRRLRAAGERVVVVPSDAVATEPGPLRADGRDTRDPDVLRAAGVGRARALYACTDDSAANTAIALAAARPREGRRPLAVYAQVADPEVCAALQARLIAAPATPGVRLDFFNVDDLAARKLVAQERLDRPDGRPPRVTVLGATAFGRALLVELARDWRLRDPGGGALLPVTVVDPDATGSVGRLAERYPFLTRVCRMTPHDHDVDDLIDGAPAGPAPDRLYICYDDEQQALKAALAAEHLWPGGSGAVVVRLDRLASLREAFDGGDLLDGLSGSLRLFGVVHAACDPALIGDDLVERLARVIHERYALDLARRGGSPDGNPALVPWHELPEPLRQANRAQAGDIGRKLRAVGCTLSPRVGPAPEHRLAENEIERLAVLEHERWLADRTATGWRHADRRDDDLRLHPAVATWAELGDDMRTRNRDEARQLPVILADAGFRIVRQRGGSSG
jgi:hypothetical protein